MSSIDDVRELVTTVRHVSAYMDSAKMAAAACGALHTLLGTDVTAIAFLDEGKAPAMQCVWGAGDEFSEQIAASELGRSPSFLAASRAVRLTSSTTGPSDASGADDQTTMDWAIAQPVVFSGETIAVLFAGQRAGRDIDERVVSLLREYSASVAPIIAMSLRAERAGDRARREERRKIAQNLHDTAGQILFGIGMNANTLQHAVEQDGDQETILLTAKEIAVQAAEASECLRAAFLSFVDDSCALPVTMREYSKLFSRRTGLHVEFVEMGEAFATPTEIDTALCAVVREGLHNVEKHASATSVFVTLTYRPREVALVIQDDGMGVAAQGDPVRCVSSGGLGLPSLFQRVGSVGGAVTLGESEDGGFTLRVSVPVVGYLDESTDDPRR